MTDKEFKNFIIRILRRGSYKWRPRNEVLKKARVARGEYQCALCGPGKTYDRHSIAVDHVYPVIDPTVGFVDWNTLIPRMFCPEDHFQVLCDDHHSEKTKGENVIRKQTRKEANEARRKQRKVKKAKDPKTNKHKDQSLDDFLKECGITLSPDDVKK